jgi:hypothetical protein
MTPELDRGTVYDWIDENLVYSVEEVEASEDDQFRFRVEANGWEVVVYKTSEDGPIQVGTTIVPPPVIKALLIKRDWERRDVQMRLDHLLTNSPGVFHYQDDNGEPTDDLREMNAIILMKPIYPDGASQHELMSTIYDMASQVNYIRTVMTLTEESIDSDR